MSHTPCFGLVARFRTPQALVQAAGRAHATYRRIEAYTPFPVAGLDEALGLRVDGVRWFALIGGLFGLLSGFFVQYGSLVFLYPLNVGGRPLESWPAFAPIVLILTLFWAGVGAFAGLLILSRLPRLHHPVFDATAGAGADRDEFLLLVRADDPAFDEHDTRALLASLDAVEIARVPR